MIQMLEDKWINLIKNSEANEETGAVKYEIKHDKNGNKYWQIETENDIFKNLSTISEYEEAAFNYILNARDNNTVIHAIDGKNMKFIRLSAEEFTNSEYSKELKVKDSETYKRKMRMLPSIEKILLNANVNWQSPDFKEHKLFKKRGFENFRGRVRIDNVIFNTVVRAGKAKFGDIFYDINLEVDQILPHGNTASEIKRSTSNDSISNNPENVNKNIKETSTGYASGEMYFTMSYEQDGKIVGTLQYGEYDGKPNIKMIEVLPEYRRKGIATQLLQHLQQKYPEQEIDFGMSTSDGTKLLDSITYNVADKKVISDRKKLKKLQTELNDLQEKLDVLYDLQNPTEKQQAELEKLGDRWQTVYEEIRELEPTLRGKKSTKTFVKLKNFDNSAEASDEGAFSMPESKKEFSISPENIRYNQERYAPTRNKKYTDYTI